MASQQCLVLIKPDGLAKSLTGNIITALSETKLKIIGAKIIKVSKELAEAHYSELKQRLIIKFGKEKGESTFEGILRYIQGEYHTERVFALVYEGNGAIEKIREIAGSTNPEEAEFTTIRGKYGRINSKTDVLELYNTYKGLIKRIQGPLGIQMTVSRQDVGIGYMVRIEPRYDTYGNIVANENEFWVDYNGYKSEKGKQRPNTKQYSKQIYCFDWGGNPIRKIEFDYPIMTFDVDWEGEFLYTIVWRGEDPEIIVHSLNEIL